MQKVRVHCFGVSLDGYSAGPSQSLDHPLGIGGLGLMEWFFRTRTFHRMHNRELENVPHHLLGQEGGEAGLDDDFAARSLRKLAPGL